MDKSSSIRDNSLIAKILIIGNSGVGKSSILAQFTNTVIPINHVPTVGVDFKTKKMKIDDAEIKLQLWDTAGQEKFRSIALNFFKGATGAVLVFDLTDEKSFEDIKFWIRQVRIYAGDEICKVIFGNKNDLPNSKIAQEFIDEITTEFSIKYFATSAKLNKNINEGMYYIAKEIKEKYYQKNDVNSSNISDKKVLQTNLKSTTNEGMCRNNFCCKN